MTQEEFTNRNSFNSFDNEFFSAKALFLEEQFAELCSQYRQFIFDFMDKFQEKTNDTDYVIEGLYTIALNDDGDVVFKHYEEDDVEYILDETFNDLTTLKEIADFMMEY